MYLQYWNNRLYSLNDIKVVICSRNMIYKIQHYGNISKNIFHTKSRILKLTFQSEFSSLRDDSNFYWSPSYHMKSKLSHRNSWTRTIRISNRSFGTLFLNIINFGFSSRSKANNNCSNTYLKADPKKQPDLHNRNSLKLISECELYTQ